MGIQNSSKAYRIRVLILAACTSYNFFTASLICLLFARISQMKTRVLCSSIFFIADSVLRGDIMARYGSIRAPWGMDFRGYLGLRGRRRVRGRRKETGVRTCRLRVDDAP